MITQKSYKYIFRLLFDIIFPFLITHEKERELFNDDPNEFVNLASDIVD